MQHEPVAVERLQRARRRVAEVQLVIDVALDRRHTVLRQQLDERALARVGHLETERILEVRHHHARGDALAFEDPFERVEIDAVDRMRRDFQRAHAHPLDRVQHRVERRRLHGDRVARLRDGLQAQVDRLGRADRHHDFAGLDHDPALSVAPRDLADQFLVAGRQIVDHAPARAAAADRLRIARETLHRKLRRIGVRRAERHRVVARDRAQRRQHEPAHVHGRRLGGRRRHVQLGLGRRRRARADEIARLRPALDQATAFQHEVRSQHGRDAELLLPARLPHRRNPLAGPVHATLDLRLEIVGQLFVTLHAPPFQLPFNNTVAIRTV